MSSYFSGKIELKQLAKIKNTFGMLLNQISGAIVLDQNLDQNLHLIFLYTRHFTPKLWDPSICQMLIKFGLHFGPHWIIFLTYIFGLLHNRTFTKNLKPCCLQYFTKYNNFKIIAQVHWPIFGHFGQNFFHREKLHLEDLSSQSW